MTQLRLILVLAGITFLADGCGRDPVTTRAHWGTLALTIAFQDDTAGQTGDLSPSRLEIDSLSVTISGLDMDTIERVFPVEDGVGDGTIENIPAGDNRTINAVAWSRDPVADLYEGSDTVTIEPGAVTEATLTMSRIRDDIVAHLAVEPESTFVNTAVIADASASFDYYLPDSLLSYRFLFDGEETRPWGPIAADTLFPTSKGSHTVTVEVRNPEETTDQADATVIVLNRPPFAPTDPSPGPGDTVTVATPVLAWSAQDPDGDDLSFTIWLADDSTAVCLEEAQAEMFESEAESVQVGILLPETTYYWKVVAQDDDTSVKGDVWCFIIPSAPIAVDPDSVVLFCDTNEDVVTLYNLTPGVVDWSASWDAEWLEVMPSAGTLARTPRAVSLLVTTRSGYQPGLVDEVITFKAGGFTVDVSVQLEVAPDLAEPLPDEIVLTEPMFEDSVFIGNAGCGDLSWEVSGVQGAWLNIFPTDGVIGEDGLSVVTIGADTTGLFPGSYTGRVDFSVVDTVQSIPVVLEISQVACLEVVPDSLHLGPNLFAAACSLFNRGNVPVAWDAEWLDSWLTLTPENGTLGPSNGAEIAVNADAAGLPTGETEAAVTFMGGDAPVILTISVEVGGEPNLVLSPRHITFPADTDTADFQIRNAGTGNLLWYVSAHPYWCEAVPTSGIVPEGEQSMVLLWVDREGVSPGSYPGGLTIDSNGGNDVLQMTLEVGVPGCDNPVYYEDFNDGEATGWQTHPSAGSWNVQDSRYRVNDILPDTLTWSKHPIAISNPTQAQADIRFPAPPIDSGIVGVFVEITSGYSLWIDGKNCDVVGAGLQWNGYVFAVARAMLTGEWFAFGAIQEADMFFAGGWNALAIAVDNSHFRAVVNGIVEVSVPHGGGTIPFESVGLLATELDTARFDRVYVCPLGG